MNPLWPAFGAIDAKITSWSLIGSGTAQAVCGPTWDAQAPFAWTEMWGDVCEMCPRVYAFEWVEKVAGRV